MVQSQFSLCWDSYKSSICGGFSALQQNGELVDMTLAADGHFVKVHQVLVALASPYLKDLILSASCQHPVIFLNNVSYKTLCLLLEYIYTGEALVRADNLASFAEAGKALHIKGLENITKNDNVKSTTDLTHMEEEDVCHISGVRGGVVMAPETSAQICLPTIPAAARKILIKHENSAVISLKHEPKSSMISKDEPHAYTDMLDDSGAQDTDDGFGNEHSMEADTNLAKDKLLSTSSLQFTVSIRGSLQMILNRYIYNLNSKVSRIGVRRWRCVDYRNNKCTAFVVTKGNVVLNRANLHNHAFHDKKILAKIEKKAVYSALDDIEGFTEREQRSNTDSDNVDISMKDDSYNLLDEFDTEMNVKTTD